MAQKTIVQLVDDLDGKELKQGEGETVTFSLDGIAYEVDMSKANAQKMRDAFGKYVDVARKVSGSRTPRKRAAARDYDPAAVRAWAKSKNIKVPERGRFPADVIEKYKAAGN